MTFSAGTSGGARSSAVIQHRINRNLGRRDYFTLALAALGGALEFYDFVIFVFFISVLGKLFFPPGIPEWIRQAQTFGIFAAGYLIRPIGGIVLAHFGDLFGRKKMFALSVLLMSVPTLALGLLPTYQTIGVFAPLLLLLMRLLQGAAVGGEVPGAWVFVSEHVPARRVGLACGILTGGLTAGILLGSLVATWINTMFDTTQVLTFAWRLPFIVGGLFGIVAMYLRRWLEETPVFNELKGRKALASGAPIKSVLREHRGAVALSMVLTWMLSATIIVIILMMPTLMQKVFGIAPRLALLGSSVATVCLTIGCALAGILSDRYGPRTVIQLGATILCVSYIALYHQLMIGASVATWLSLYALSGFMVGTIGAIPLLMVTAFPAAVRFSGISFSYNVAYAAFGGLTPILISLAIPITPYAPIVYVIGVCAIAAVAVSFVRGKPVLT